MTGFLRIFEARLPLIYALLTTRLWLTLLFFTLMFVGVSYISYAGVILNSENLVTEYGPIVGGDYMVFHTAGRAAIEGWQASLYDMHGLTEKLHSLFDFDEENFFTWHYPPTALLLTTPFASAPYLMSFFLWVGAFAGFFLIMVHTLWPRAAAVYFAGSSAPVFTAIITGQNGLLTGGLLAGAGGFAASRPVLAGVCAGILTIKPQLGVLIPIAFISGGCWRAFGVATITSVALAGVSVLAFGTEAWVQFFQTLTDHSDRLSGGDFPIGKMVTPYAAALLIGLPQSIAGGIQALVSIGCCVYVFFVWRQFEVAAFRLGSLATATMLASPYAFYYELAIVVPAMVLIARHAVENGWLPLEKASLIALAALAIGPPGSSDIPGFPISFSVAFFAFAVVARRIAHAAEFRFATSAQPAQAGS